jgi:hypothetical protein
LVVPAYRSHIRIWDGAPLWQLEEWGSSSLGIVLPNSEVQESGTYGVLKMTLHDASYEWEFVPIAGDRFTDFGLGSCHGPPPSG